MEISTSSVIKFWCFQHLNFRFSDWGISTLNDTWHESAVTFLCPLLDSSTCCDNLLHMVRFESCSAYLLWPATQSRSKLWEMKISNVISVLKSLYWIGRDIYTDTHTLSCPRCERARQLCWWGGSRFLGKAPSLNPGLPSEVPRSQGILTPETAHSIGRGSLAKNKKWARRGDHEGPNVTGRTLCPDLCIACLSSHLT